MFLVWEKIEKHPKTSCRLVVEVININLCLIDELISNPLVAAPLRQPCVVLEQREELLRVQEFDSRLLQTAS